MTLDAGLCPDDPTVGRWYWLERRLHNQIRHAAWYWCDECRQWEFEPDHVVTARQAQQNGWRIVAPAVMPAAR